MFIGEYIYTIDQKKRLSIPSKFRTALGKKAVSHRIIRDYVDEYVLADGSRRYILAQGRLINLSAAEGHPAEVMDMSFANQILAVEFLLKNKNKLSNSVHLLPEIFYIQSEEELILHQIQ